MAQPIKAIPTLYGEAARRFQEMADETERKYDISPKRDIKKILAIGLCAQYLKGLAQNRTFTGGSRTG